MKGDQGKVKSLQKRAVEKEKKGDFKGAIDKKSVSAEVAQENFFSLTFFLKVLPFVLFVSVPPLFKYEIEFVWSKISVAYLSILLSVPALIYLYFKNDRKISFNFPHTLIPVSAFIIWGIVSAFWAYNPYKTQNLAVMIAPGILSYLALQFLSLSERELKVIAIFTSFTSSVVSGYGILQLLGVFPMPPDQYGNPNPITTFGLSNFAVEYLLLAFPLTVAFAIVEKNPILKTIFIISSAITFGYIVGAKNRAGWVGTIVFLITLTMILLLHFSRKADWRKILKYFIPSFSASVVIIVLLLFYTDYGRSIIERFKTFVELGPGSSVSTRVLAWSGGIEMIKQNPVIGVGGGNFEIFSWRYAPRLLDEATMYTNTRVDKAHNEYLQIFADLGIIGFALFISIIFLVFKMYLEIFNAGGKKENEEFFFVSTGLFLGIFSTLAGASFNFSLQWPGSVIMFWFYIGFIELFHSRIRGEEYIEFDTHTSKWVTAGVSLLIFAGSLGFPCINGIPVCQGKKGFDKLSCDIRRFPCRASIGFFASRNLMLAEIYYRIAQWQKRFRNFDVAEKYYLASLQFDNPAERTYYDLAYLYLGKNGGMLNPRTLALLEETLKYVPYFGKGRRELGRMYIQLGQIDKGIEYVMSSTYSNPANIPEAYAIVANAYYMKGDYAKAIEYGQRAIAEIENSPSVKDYKLKIPERIFDENEVRFLALSAIGLSYAQLKDYEKAKGFLEAAKSIRPQDTRILVNLSTVYINLGKFDLAESILNSIEPQDYKEKGAKFFNLASLYAAKGDKDKAMEYLSLATEVDPSLIDRAYRDKFLKSILFDKEM
ncbi:hypothetical protein HRbin19_01563 [bacterium HR19]|nr:hypothetical protein HRbin19_01563 [bacterium HR19]